MLDYMSILIFIFKDNNKFSIVLIWTYILQ